MNVATTQARPGLRRAVEALSRLASEREADTRRPAPDWRAALIAAQRRAIGHYKVLLGQPMPPAEQQIILGRIARLEDEIEALEADEALWLRAA